MESARGTEKDAQKYEISKTSKTLPESYERIN